MWSNQIHLELRGVVPVNANHHPEQQQFDAAEEEDKPVPFGGTGGFLADGSYTWVARGSSLDVFCTRSGDKVLTHNFECDSKTKNCTVCAVHEMKLEDSASTVVAVGVQLEANTGMVAALSLQGARVLGRIDISEAITCIEPVRKASYSRGRIAEFNGCFAVGTVSGKVLLVDACLRLEQTPIFGQRLVMNRMDKNQCHVEFASAVSDIASSHELVRRRELYYSLQLESPDEETPSSPVTSLLDLPALMAIAVGHADGRLVLYDLLDLHIMHVSQPPAAQDCPIISMNLVEPADDPKACVYIWTFHAGEEGAFAVLHTLMYEEKYAEAHGNVYERFISCSPRLNIPCYDAGSFPLNVQSIMKSVSQEEEVLTLCVLSWICSDKSTNILVFDLNQWYKAEMPFNCDWRHELNHTVVFNVKHVAVNIRLIVESLIPFNSIQRPEEHFCPNSLSFDILSLNNGNCARYHWIGLQNKILQYLEQSGSACLMSPENLYNVMLRAALIPQFVDYNFTQDASVSVQRELLLSVALEYNCYSLLRECAINWADGSHLGQKPEEGVSLSTLTSWIWARAKALKDLSNSMCVPLFDLSGRRIDCGTQKTLLHCSRQLRQLSKLCDVVFIECRQYIPEKVYKSLKSQENSIQLAADFQEVVQWLLNVGLLPEGNIDGINLSDEFLLVPFPYQAIRSYYASQRTLLNDRRPEKGTPLSVEEHSCKYLFIDNFIEREFPSDALRKMWIENNASGTYPPNSMQNLLRSLLVSNVDANVKYVLLCYTFMDMTAVLGDGRYGGIVQNLIKFPAVFKLNSAIIKRTQAFWFLDHGNIDGAIEELLSPMSQSEQFPHWQREFLVSALLRYDVPHLALRVLRAPGKPISPFLELKTLLENNLISEAFKLQRSKHDTNLLRCFYEGTLKASKYEVLLDLAFSDEESRILREYLAKTSQPMADNVHFIHLLQKLDFVEAVHMLDKLGRRQYNEYNLEAPREALALYHAALEPTTQHISYLAYAEQKKLKPPKGPYTEPLSTRLIRGRAEFRGKIYHKSIVSIKEAAEPLEHAQPFLEKPGLGIFQFRSQIKSSNVCYPIKTNTKVAKRKLGNDGGFEKQRSAAALGSDVFFDYEKPKKRRKLDTVDSEYETSSLVAPKSVLTEFRPRKPCFNFGSRNSESVSDKSVSRSPSAQLTTPLIPKRQPYNPPSPESVSSYTPHGILKSTASVQSFALRRSVSPTAMMPCFAPVVQSGLSRASDSAEEKILRFDLPESPQVEKKDPPCFETKTPTLEVTGVNDSSLVSNDEFFSPEASSVFEDGGGSNVDDASDFLATGPKRRRSIHSQSRSTTPVENNIAIIIEDVADDDSGGRAPQLVPVDENDVVIPMEDVEEDEELIPAMVEHAAPATRNVFTERKSLERLVLEANARKALIAEQQSAQLLPLEEMEVTVQLEQDMPIEQPEKEKESPEAADEVNEISDEAHRESALSSEEARNAENEVIGPDGGTETEETIVIDKTDSESGGDSTDEEGGSSSGSDLSEIEEDEVENSEASSEEVDLVEEIIDISSSSEDGNGMDGNANSSSSDNDTEEDDNSDDDDDNDVGGQQSVPRASDVVTEEQDVDQLPSGNVVPTYPDSGAAGPTVRVSLEHEAMGDIGGTSSDAQVSTTTSSTSNPESGEENSERNDAEDLTVQQEAAAVLINRDRTPEPPSTSRAKDLSIPGGERPEQSAPDVELKLLTPSPKKEDPYLGKPKNAHELDIPAMNLSVKPEEAHEANRKNSKSDESDDPAALNLSTGQLSEPLRVDEPTSGSENAEEMQLTVDEPSVEMHGVAHTPELDPMEGSSSGALRKKPSPKTSSFDSEALVTPRKTRKMSADGGGTTPRSNVRTRRMSAMDKIEENAAEPTTPSRRLTRASSVVKDIALTPLTPLSRGKRQHASMSNLSSTPDSAATLTPRRSTRATSLAKEVLAVKSATRRRRLSETFGFADANESVIVATPDDCKSEKSNESESIRRSARKSLAVEPTTSKAHKTAAGTDEESFAEYTTNRRLTRHQSAVIEKSLEMVRNLNTASEVMHTSAGSLPEEHDSEPESVVSNASNTSKQSTRSQTRNRQGSSLRNRDKGPAVTYSGGRSTRSSTSKRESSDAESVELEPSPSKKPTLETISEEADVTVAAKSKRRGRPRKGE